MKNERLIGYALVAIGAVAFISQLGGTDWLWVGILAAAFLAGYVSRKNYGFLVAGSILAGVAVGMMFDTQAGMLLSLAVGFFAIDRVEPRPNRWPLYVAGILAVLGAFSALSLSGLFGSVGFALLLIGAGAYLLLRDRGVLTGTGPATAAPTAPPPNPPTPTAPTPTSSAPSTPAATPTPEGAVTPQPHPAPPPPSAPPTVGGGDPGVEAPSADLTAEPGAPQLTPEARARLGRLETWRRETATAEGTPAYIVFRNETLEQLALRNPQTLAEVGEVKGIGPVKLERYGEAVLRVLRGDAPLQN